MEAGARLRECPEPSSSHPRALRLARSLSTAAQSPPVPDRPTSAALGQAMGSAETRLSFRLRIAVFGSRSATNPDFPRAKIFNTSGAPPAKIERHNGMATKIWTFIDRQPRALSHYDGHNPFQRNCPPYVTAGVLSDRETVAGDSFPPGGGPGDKERALDGLDQAYEAGSQWLTWMKVDQMFDPLRSEPRFIALLKKVGFGSASKR
jgi:hypothetical protein